MFVESGLLSAFLAQVVAVLALSLGLADWLALSGQLASLALLVLVALKVLRGSGGMLDRLDSVARKAHAEHKEILARLDDLERKGR